MSGKRGISGAGRAIAFGRHIPLSKLARRIELDLRRRLLDRLPERPRFVSPPPPRGEHPPLPVMPPRPGLAVTSDGKLVLRALGRTIAMPDGYIDWQAPGPGPEHQLLRMNLHYMEYLEDSDDGLFAALTTEWIDANPQQRPGSWRDSWNSFALSLRAVVWMQQLAQRAGRLPESLVTRLHASLAEQLRYLERNLETDLGGNHLIKNIKALLWAGGYFVGEEAARWRQLGRRLLRRELEHQVLADGVHYERSPSYHCQVLADLIECRLALSTPGSGETSAGPDGLDGALDETIRLMAQPVADVTHPDGLVAQFNDAGLAMAYAPADCLDACERLLGSRPMARQVFAYEAAGYFGRRSEASYFVVDCGRIAPDDLPAHGHGDVLSFEWSLAGQRLIVDQGVFEYFAGDRRAASRSAANHNTVCLDGADQADFYGAFRCGRRPDVEVRRWERRDDGFLLEGSHNGFAHLPGSPIHVRRFEVSSNVITIDDRIEGTTDRDGSVRFLLHPDTLVEVQGTKALLARGEARVILQATAPVRNEPAVWWPDIGHELTTRRLTIALPRAGAMTATFHTSPQGKH